MLEIERDPDGSTFVRVTEQPYSPFGAAAPANHIKDKNLGPAPGSNNVIEGNVPTLVSKVAVSNMKYGLTLQESGTVSIEGYSYNSFAGGGSIYGGAIKLGDNKRPTGGPTYIQRVFADGMQTPDATYKVSNNDFLGVEEDSGPIYVRGVTGRNFGDAGIDTKSTQVFVMNATLEGAHRILRAWPGVEIVLVDEGDVDAEVDEGLLQQVDGSAVQLRGRDDVPPLPGECEEGDGDGGLTGGDSHCRDATLKGGDAVFQNLLRGAGVAAVQVA